MNDILQEEKGFVIDSVPEPEKIEDVIFSLMVNPNLSSINYFNDFSDVNISPDSIGNDDARIIQIQFVPVLHDQSCRKASQ